MSTSTIHRPAAPGEDQPPAGAERYPARDPRERHLRALHRADDARRRAAEAEVAYAAGEGTHEDADRLRRAAEAAEAEVLQATADAGNLLTYMLRAATASEPTARVLRALLVDVMYDLMRPVWDDLTSRLVDLEAVTAGVDR